MTEVEQEQFKLPKGWAETGIGDICDLINGRAFKPSEWAPAGVPIIRIQNLNDHEAKFNYCNFEVEEKYLVDNGQLLFAWSGTPETSFGAHVWNRGKAILNQHIFKVNINEDCLDKTFLKHLLNRNVKEYIGKAHGTAGLAHITKGKFENSRILLPPFNEQGRITSKVEALFSFLDVGVESLRKVRAQLKHYRQAVLKYAFEGKLTEEWRKTHRDQLEPATRILEQISQEKAVESNLPELPEGWVCTRLELITTNHDGKRVPVSRKKRESMKGVYSYYGASGIIDSVDNYLFDGNFLLIGEDGANLLARATPIAFQATGKFWVNNHAHVLTPLGGIPISYLEHYINRISLTEYITGTAQPKLTQRAMNKIPVPLAPFKEQFKIAEEISRRFSVIDEISKEIELMIKYSDKLRHSILKTAFEGKLIPQDPNDEPAEKLLERIKTERFNRKSKFHNQLELSTYVK